MAQENSGGSAVIGAASSAASRLRCTPTTSTVASDVFEEVQEKCEAFEMDRVAYKRQYYGSVIAAGGCVIVGGCFLIVVGTILAKLHVEEWLLLKVCGDFLLCAGVVGVSTCPLEGLGIDAVLEARPITRFAIFMGCFAVRASGSLTAPHTDVLAPAWDRLTIAQTGSKPVRTKFKSPKSKK